VFEDVLQGSTILLWHVSSENASVPVRPFGEAFSMHVQIPTSNDVRAVIFTRSSTVEQQKHNHELQKNNCLTYLAEQHGISSVTVLHYREEANPGTHSDRPGIHWLRQLVVQNAVDVILADESSRLFRRIGSFQEFADLSSRHGVRIVCLNDGIDTAQENWMQRLG
jgi:DNA invertase Pin-like site-specific DNA recombinase